MKARTALLIIFGVVAALVLSASLYHYLKAGGFSAMYVPRAKYEADLKEAIDARKPMEAEILKLKDEKKELTVQLAEDAKTIATLKGNADAAHQAQATAEQETARLKANAQAAIDANPAVKALVENLEFRLIEKDKELCAKDAIIARIGVPVDTGKLDEDGDPLLEFQPGTVTWRLGQRGEKYKARAALWEERCRRAEGLLATCDSLRKASDRMAASARFGRAADLAGEAFISAYSALKHKDVTPFLFAAGKEGVVQIFSLFHR